MGLIEDIRYEMSELDSSEKSLRKFGIVMGAVFLLIAAIGSFGNWGIAASITLTLVGVLLFVFGWFVPRFLRVPHRIWMVIASVLGWIMSRMILAMLFYCIITPIALIGKLVRKKFLDLSFRDSQNSYWIQKDQSLRSKYEKLY